MPAQFEKALAAFPFSRLSPNSTLRVYAIGFGEAPLMEEVLEGGIAPGEIAQAASEFLNEDCAFQIEAKWDLWQRDHDWKLAPSRVVMELYAPLFENDRGDHFRIEAGPEYLFLPEGKERNLRAIQSNIRSVLRLTQDLSSALGATRKLLWTDSGANFAGQLEAALL